MLSEPVYESVSRPPFGLGPRQFILSCGLDDELVPTYLQKPREGKLWQTRCNDRLVYLREGHELKSQEEKLSAEAMNKFTLTLLFYLWLVIVAESRRYLCQTLAFPHLAIPATFRTSDKSNFLLTIPSAFRTSHYSNFLFIKIKEKK